MTDMLRFAPAFASPAAGEATGVVGALALARLNSTRRRIASRLEESSQADAARALLAFSAGQGSAWRPETGLALQDYREGATGLAALQLGAACAGMGGSGSFQAQVDRPQWLYFDGWLSPVSGCCSLAADGYSFHIDSDLGPVEFLASGGNHWSLNSPRSSPWIPYASGGLAPRYVTASGLRHSEEGFPWISVAPPLSVAEPPAAADARIATIHRAWQLILEHTPEYGPWVASTATGCLLLDPNGKRSAQSGSSYDHPGLIAIEPPDCPIFCGEILVHECSHQQLLVYGMVAPLVRPGSEETSYSPIKRSYRTIDRVLTGGHAVGNMIIYYAKLRRALELDTASQERFDRHCTWFAGDYRPALSQSESLTQAGRELWSSLCKAVDGALEN